MEICTRTLSTGLLFGVEHSFKEALISMRNPTKPDVRLDLAPSVDHQLSIPTGDNVTMIILPLLGEADNSELHVPLLGSGLRPDVVK